MWKKPRGSRDESYAKICVYASHSPFPNSTPIFFPFFSTRALKGRGWRMCKGSFIAVYSWFAHTYTHTVASQQAVKPGPTLVCSVPYLSRFLLLGPCLSVFLQIYEGLCLVTTIQKKTSRFVLIWTKSQYHVQGLDIFEKTLFFFKVFNETYDANNII